jgi:para-nitrobenzyl esterase
MQERPNGERLDVDVTGGTVRGVLDRDTLVWRGIPYAAPPVGDLRLRAPQPVVPWGGTRYASRYGRIAPQSARPFRIGDPDSDEDCLTLNVLVPASMHTTPSALPVMVFIHGGGYSTGSSRDFSGQGAGFARAGRVVYVSLNYRLGALGYLDFSRYSSEDRAFDSNLGLRDQVAALEWVRDNIAAFGGDPANVTVFGESAGGNAVTTLLATPSADGLFARAIAQSAPPSAVYSPRLTAEWAGEFVTILRNVVANRAPRDAGAGPFASAAQPADLLTSVTATELVRASLTLQVRIPDEYPGAFCFAPVVDGAFLPEPPIVAIREGRASRVPLIIGTNDREGSIFRGRIDILPRSPRRLRALFEQAPIEARAPMRNAYPGLPARRPAADFSGDYGFWYPSIRLADFHSRYVSVHAYRFDFAPRLLRAVGLDATHGSEMFGLFDSMDVPLARAMTALGDRERYVKAGERMRNYWLAFAEGGTLPAAWPSYTERERVTLIIDAVDRREADPRRERRLAWDVFVPDLADDPLPEPDQSGARQGS